MAKEICISSTPHETRLAILEDDQLAEIYYERENEYTLAGSIYNGRVTRVLPGMQSAFVDIGLERDAFLYVTDFLELEDQEESEELERAAASGPAPQDIRHGDGRGARNGQRHEPRQDPRGGQERSQDRGSRERRPELPAITEDAEGHLTPIEPPIEAAEPEPPADESAAGGARRWRGRRRRRGGRPHGGPSEGRHETQEGAEPEFEAREDLAEAPAIHAASFPVTHTEPPLGKPSFVLPGESLSKYGGPPASSSKTQEGAMAPSPPKPVSTFKPSTLIEKPLAWDGSGLLPGESLSRHRSRQPEPAVEFVAEIPQDLESAADAIEERTLVEEMEEAEEPAHSYGAPPANESEIRIATETPHGHVHGAAEHLAVQEAESGSEDEFETTEFVRHTEPEPEIHEWRSDPLKVSIDFFDPDAHEIPEPVSEADEDQPHVAKGDLEGHSEGEENRSASHHVDPLPPSGFRLFGLGGKKKKSDDDDGDASHPDSATKAEPPAAAAELPAENLPAGKQASAFSPGQGVIEEEVIEGEEYEGPAHHHHKAEDQDLEDFEEETLQTQQIRSGELGELLQEAHLDHRIQLEFEGKNGEDEENEEEESEEEELAGAGATSTAPAEGAAPQRRDRNVRGRRGGRSQAPRGRGAARRAAQTSDLPIISDLLKPGQEILVQIAKEPIAKKGARITSHIALPGRFLVFMPTVSHVGVSRKISSDEERQRLKRILISERGEASGGFIVRTAAEGASEDELRADLRFLLHLWEEIRMRSESSKAPALIYHDLSLIERILRDQVSANFSSIWVDSEADYERIVRFLNRFSPSLVRRVKLYTKETPLFEHFGIQDEISKALRSKVWLKSGGSIVINQTEALVAIDINTGKYVGKTARLEDTILKTNLDAIPEIVRQIRLRDLGGIIVIDFIDMDERKNRFKVMAALEEALKNDRAPTKVLQFNDFGLVAITRKRVKQSLERTLSVPCPTCQATGMVKGPTTVANEIYIELRKMKKHFENADVLLRVHPETVKILKANNANWLTEFEELVGKNILVKSDATLHPEQFDIQG